MSKLFYLILSIVPVSVWACPNCHSAVSDEGKPPYTLYILGGFILLTYIPFYILFRAAKKFDPQNANGNE